MKKNLNGQIIERYLLAFDTICTEKQIDDKDLCKQLKIKPTSLSQLRGGRIKSIKADHMVDICIKHNFSLLWMGAGIGEERTTNEVFDLKASIEEIRKNIKRVSDSQANIIEKFLNEIINIKATKEPSEQDLLKGNVWKKKQ